MTEAQIFTPKATMIWPTTPLDEDDLYPTEESIVFVRGYRFDYDRIDLFDFIKSIWWTPEMLWDEEDGVDQFGHAIRTYRISTGGWSGNEDIIRALEKNLYAWHTTWVQSRRGGHYIFEVHLEQTER